MTDSDKKKKPPKRQLSKNFKLKPKLNQETEGVTMTEKKTFTCKVCKIDFETQQKLNGHNLGKHKNTERQTLTYPSFDKIEWIYDNPENKTRQQMSSKLKVNIKCVNNLCRYMNKLYIPTEGTKIPVIGRPKSNSPKQLVKKFGASRGMMLEE